VISDATVALDENSANGTVVYDLNDGGNDTDADGTALTYTITAGNGAGGFALNAASGLITVANSAVLDFETTPSFVLTVQASDGTLTDTAAITINLNNLNDNAPPVANNVSANGSEDDVSIAITLTGSDANDTVASFRLLGLPGNGVLYTDAGLTSAAVVGVDYAAAGNALTLYLVPASDWNGATAFLFTATDTNGASDVTPATATITVTAVNDPPAATNLSAPETYTEDTLLDLVDIVVSDVDGGNVTVTLTLSDIAAGTLNTATVGGVTSTFVGGVWIASGALADVNALLAGLTFTPAANYNSNFTIATAVSDGAAPPLTGTKVVTGTPVNDAPVLGSNSFAVSDGGTLVLTNGNLSATDVDDAAANLVFTVSGVMNGQFQVLGAPVTTFTQAQLVAGQVQFVHDGSGLAPTFTLEVSDPAAAVDGPYLGNIVFNGGGGGAGGSGGAGGRGVAGSGVGSGGGAVGTSIVLLPSAESAIVPLTFRPDVLPHPLFPLVDPVAQRFLRRPTVESGSGQDVAPASTTAPADTRDEPARQPASRDAAPQELSPPSAAPPVHNQADRVAKPLFDSDRRVEPARAAATVPTRYVPAEKGDAQGTDSIETEVRVMGIVASIGAVESIARATGLVAQLLAGSPTRSRKPPFVLVRAKRRRKRRGAATRTGGRRQPAKRGKPRRSSKR
jgi:hypothetical protein